MARGHRERADVVRHAAVKRRDEVGEREVRMRGVASELLAQGVQRRELAPACLVRVDGDVVADAVRRPNPDDRLGRDPALVDDPG